MLEPPLCPFCDPEEELTFYKGERVLALYDAFPVSPGHALIVTRRHTSDWFTATPEERTELMAATEVARLAISARHQPDGFNIGMEIGRAAGQTIDHLHLHVIPRYAGDAVNPRGGIRWVLPARADYLGDTGRVEDVDIKGELVEAHPEFAEPYAKTLLRFRNVMAAPTTFARVMSITPIQFGNHRGVGATYVEGLASLQQQIRATWPFIDWSSPGPGSPSVQLPRSAAQLNRTLMSPGEEKALAKLGRHLGHEPALDELLDLNLTSTLGVQGFGRQSVEHLMRLRRRVMDLLRNGALSRPPDDRTKPALVVVAWPGGLSPEELDRTLLADLERFLGRQEERWADAVASRLGFRTSRMTFAELGDRFEVSRQRVRQVVAQAFDAFSHHLSVHPSVVRATAASANGDDLGSAFPRLAEAFGDLRWVRRFLELAADAEKGTLYPYRPSGQLLAANAVDPYFADHGSPVREEALVTYLESDHGLATEDARHHIGWLIDERRLQRVGEALEPRALTRSQAIAHVLVGAADGLPWAEVAARINAMGCSRYPVDESRLSGFGEAPRVYLWGLGVYRHVRYFEADCHDVERTLDAVRGFLTSRDLEAANLHDVHRSLALEDGTPGLAYFDLRYIVAAYGEGAGLFFSGSSKVDTVSLSEEAGSVPREEAVFRIVAESSRPLPGPEIASRLYSTSPAFVAVLIQRLVAAERVVRVKGGYVTAPD